jgi:hypothetical protein
MRVTQHIQVLSYCQPYPGLREIPTHLSSLSSWGNPSLGPKHISALWAISYVCFHEAWVYLLAGLLQIVSCFFPAFLSGMSTP